MWLHLAASCLDVCGEVPRKVPDLSQSLHQQKGLWLLQELLQGRRDQHYGECEAVLLSLDFLSNVTLHGLKSFDCPQTLSVLETLCFRVYQKSLS